MSVWLLNLTCKGKIIESHHVFGTYRLGPVNSKSFVSQFFLQIKWIFELNILL